MLKEKEINHSWTNIVESTPKSILFETTNKISIFTV